MTSATKGRCDRQMTSSLAYAPIAVMRLDFSAVADYCDGQRRAGAADIGATLAEPGTLGDLLAKVEVTDVNDCIVGETGVGGRIDLLGAFDPELYPYMSPNAFVEQVTAVFEGRGSVRVDSETTDRDGSRVRRILSWSASRVDGLPDYSDVLLIAEDVTGSATGTMEHSVHREQLEAMIEIGGQLTAMLEPSVIFAKVLKTIDDALHPTHAALLLVDEENESITASAGSSFDRPTYDWVISGLAGRAMRAGVALISDDISKEPGFGEPARSRATVRPGWSQIAAPIVSAGRAIGAILLEFAPTGEGPTAEAASFIGTLAQQAAVAITNAEVYGDLAASHRALHEAHEQLKQTQTQLLSAQKLEAIGSLAAGIAHEINTPIQYVSDNISFLWDSAQAVFDLIAEVDAVMEVVGQRGDNESVARYRAAVEAADLDFIAQETPDAFKQTKEGVEHVAAIVRAMKEFSHPGNDEKVPIDINRCIETTLEVAKNEWKYVADIDLQLDPDLPQVPALTGPFNQTMLILIVNAAQALEGSEGLSAAGKGVITISTCVEGDHAVIRVADNGPGIDPGIADQIFDPFFTTKEIGKGSGQGLSIAHSAIFERHGGTIHAESGPGEGATFVVRLPLDG